jgi:protein TonB
MTAAPAEAAPAVPTALPGSQDEVRQYIAAVMRELNRHKKYPRDLKKAKVEGTVIIRFTIDRSGRLIESSVQQSSGHAGLDQAAMDMLTGAAPLPSIPEFMNRDELALAVPVDYSLITDR